MTSLFAGILSRASATDDQHRPLDLGDTPVLQVKVYDGKHFIHRSIDPLKLSTEMFICGTEQHVLLTFTQTQHYLSSRIKLADWVQNRVHLRVLPLIFHFAETKALNR